MRKRAPIAKFRGSTLLFCGLSAVLTQLAPARAAGRENELLIRYRNDVKAADISRGVSNARLQLKEYFTTGPIASGGKAGFVIADTGMDPDVAVRVLKKDPSVELVERNAKFHAASVSNDSFYVSGDLWNMYGDLTSPANAYGSQAGEAWAAGYTGSQSVYVAILDGGIEITHPDLAANIWTNPFDSASGAGNAGVDNDSNGYIDDVHGWDFYDEDNTVTEPTYGHGTMVAGIIGAVGGNAAGVAGVNWQVTIIPERVTQNGDGFISDAVLGIDYAIDLKQRHGLNIVALNASWGGTTYSESLHEAIIRAAKAGILFVAPAGNSTANNDSVAFWPANIDTTVATTHETAASYNSVISVASIDSSGNLASFSNYGATKVHIGAPGVDIISTYLLSPEGDYGQTFGTSLSAAHVAGALALYASSHPTATAQQIRAAILNSAAPTPSLSGKTTTGGRLDLSTVINAASVVGRHMFYNRSAWDGNDAAANSSDDAAIATDKSALLPGGTATFANYTSYSRGINGIMIDIANANDANAISASDFSFKVGNDNTPSGWAAGPAPSSVTVRAGAGVAGSTRVTIIWADNVIQKQWIQVTVLANSTTGLPTADVFYFGNALGDVGDSASTTTVNALDAVQVRFNQRNSENLAPIDFRYDINRDRVVNALDAVLIRVNATNSETALVLLQPGA